MVRTYEFDLTLKELDTCLLLATDLTCRQPLMILIFISLIYLVVLFIRRELQTPQGSSPEPVIGSATCILENMRGMPILFGGLVLDPEGLAEPAVKGGCEDTPCTKGSVDVFDKPAHGWEAVKLISSPYPKGRAGHTMTGASNWAYLPNLLFVKIFDCNPFCSASCTHDSGKQAPTPLLSPAAATRRRHKGPEAMCRRASRLPYLPVVSHHSP